MTEEFKRLLEAAIAGNVEMARLGEVNPDVLCDKNEKRNTCLHIASLCGHKTFCTKILEEESRVPSVRSLLSAANNDDETPLLIAVKSGHVSLAEDLLEEYSSDDLNLLQQDRQGCNVLHHAIRNGYEDLAVKLIDQQPALSESCNNRQESPMFMAVLKGFKDVYVKLLHNERAIYTGAAGYNALHAAMKYGNQDFVRLLVDERPVDARNLAEQEDNKHDTPMHLAAHFNRDEILKLLLEFDQSLGYITSSREGIPLLYAAATRGHVAFARELLGHCPDAPYRTERGKTCLHEAICEDRIKFVEFILEEKSIRQKLVNMLDDDGNSALHFAVKKCNPKMVSALLAHPDIDKTVINNYACTAIWTLNEFNDLSKTINWNKIFLDIYEADPRSKVDIYNLHEQVRNNVIMESRKDAKSLIQTYTGNTSLVAILIATITFAAAFTLPGGYSSAAGSEGLPIMARNPAFQAFLVFDTLAMCSALAVAFICIIARWMDFEFLLHYRFFTKKLMWFSYMATTQAFATGLYTVLNSRLHWLAITICVLSALLPILTMLIGEWPILKLKIRYRITQFNSDFLDMV